MGNRLTSYLKRFQAFKDRVSDAVGVRERPEGPISPIINDAVTTAINNRWKLNISYQGVGGTKVILPTTYRILPLMLGLARTTHNHLLRAWVYSGGGHIGGFVTFRMDRILSAAPIKKPVDTPPDGYNNASDALMGEIILKIEFPEN